MRATSSHLVGIFTALALSAAATADTPDSLVVRTFTFDDLETRRATFSFPTEGRTWRSIQMRHTLKCDEATTADEYPCGEWDVVAHDAGPRAHRPDGLDPPSPPIVQGGGHGARRAGVLHRASPPHLHPVDRSGRAPIGGSIPALRRHRLHRRSSRGTRRNRFQPHAVVLGARKCRPAEERQHHRGRRDRRPRGEHPSPLGNGHGVLGLRGAAQRQQQSAREGREAGGVQGALESLGPSPRTFVPARWPSI